MNPLSNPDELKAKLAAIEAEFIGWLPLEGGAYLHMGKEDEAAVLINVVGVPERRAGGPHDPVADMSTLQRITTEYIELEDRIRLRLCDGWYWQLCRGS